MIESTATLPDRRGRAVLALVRVPLVQVVSHAAACGILAPTFWALSLTGSGGVGGLSIRVVSSLLIFAVALLGASATVRGVRAASFRTALSFGLVAVYLVLLVGWSRGSRAVLVFPRAGALDLKGMSIGRLARSAIANLGVIQALVFGLTGVSGWRTVQRERMRARLASLASASEDDIDALLSMKRGADSTREPGTRIE